MKKSELIDLLNKKPIDTQRALLRPMNESDLDDFLTHTTCSMSLEGTELESLFKDNCKALLSSESEITFSIRLKENSSYIGYFEFKGLDDKPEIGIDLIEDYQNQGFGFEICRFVIDYLFDNTDFKVLNYNCFRNNEASLKLAKKLGAIQTSERVLFDMLQKADVSQETLEESVGFDLIIHEIRKGN